MHGAQNYKSLPNCEIDIIIIEGAVEKQEWFLLARCALKSHDFCHKKLEAKYGWSNSSSNNFFCSYTLSSNIAAEMVVPQYTIEYIYHYMNCTILQYFTVFVLGQTDR